MSKEKTVNTEPELSPKLRHKIDPADEEGPFFLDKLSLNCWAIKDRNTGLALDLWMFDIADHGDGPFTDEDYERMTEGAMRIVKRSNIAWNAGRKHVEADRSARSLRIQQLEEALRWYEDEVAALAQYRKTDAAASVLTTLMNDAGGRARALLSQGHHETMIQ